MPVVQVIGSTRPRISEKRFLKAIWNLKQYGNLNPVVEFYE